VDRRSIATILVLALLGALRAALRTCTDLTLENLALRQQLTRIPCSAVVAYLKASGAPVSDG
jgi:hypothetical protein